MTTIQITRDNIAATVAENDIVFLDFWAGWCAPCRAFAPVFESASATHPDIAFGKVDTDAEQELAAGFRITSIPTLMAFRQGVLVFSQPGALRGPQLDQVITAVREIDMDAVRTQIAEQQEAAQ